MMMAEERINEHEDTSVETIQSERNRNGKKKIGRSEQELGICGAFPNQVLTLYKLSVFGKVLNFSFFTPK